MKAKGNYVDPTRETKKEKNRKREQKNLDKQQKKLIIMEELK